MTIKQLETQLLALSPTEKTEAIHLLAHSLNQNWRGITKTRNVCGGDACIAGTRIPVWVLVNARNLGISESQLLYDYPTLTAIDLANAWIYAQVNPEEVATAIQENEAY
ncbi:MAG: DUF433 domain-containing protein [Moorea sp. SIO4A3]|nr:DUF433 domain-containing protein [Moorena sp. SIO4A3]